MKKPKENEVVRMVLDYLALRRIFAWRNNNVPTYDAKRGCFRSFVGLKGTSDILGVLPGGRFLAVECKSATGAVRPEQRAFLDAVAGLGGVAVVARGIEDVAAALALALEGAS